MSSLARYKRIQPAVITVGAGTPTGDISDLQHFADGNQYQIQEQAGTPALRLTIDFVNVRSILAVYVLGNYVGSTTHCENIEIWNYTTSAWDIIDSFSTRICLGAHTAWVFDDSDYINGSNEAIVRLDHPQSGNSSHDLYIEYIALLY